jgi:hypothetical protein
VAEHLPEQGTGPEFNTPVLPNNKEVSNEEK